MAALWGKLRRGTERPLGWGEEAASTPWEGSQAGAGQPRLQRVTLPSLWAGGGGDLWEGL